MSTEPKQILGIAGPETPHTGYEPVSSPHSVPPRQLLRDRATTPELRAALEAACQQLGYRTASERLWVEEELKLQYYYGGQDVACLPTAAGRMVVGAGVPGSGSLRTALQQLTGEERAHVTILEIEPWDDTAVTTPSVRSDEV